MQLGWDTCGLVECSSPPQSNRSFCCVAVEAGVETSASFSRGSSERSSVRRSLRLERGAEGTAPVASGVRSGPARGVHGRAASLAFKPDMLSGARPPRRFGNG